MGRNIVWIREVEWKKTDASKKWMQKTACVRMYARVSLCKIDAHVFVTERKTCIDPSKSQEETWLHRMMCIVLALCIHCDISVSYYLRAYVCMYVYICIIYVHSFASIFHFIGKAIIDSGRWQLREWSHRSTMNFWGSVRIIKSTRCEKMLVHVTRGWQFVDRFLNENQIRVSKYTRYIFSSRFIEFDF